MRFPKLFITLLSVAAMASAQAALPTSVGKAKQVLTVTQKVSTSGGVSLSADVSPLVNSTKGFGTTVLRTSVRLPQTVGSMVSLPIAPNTSESAVLTAAKAHFKNHGPVLASQMEVWMKANGVSFAWYSYEQSFTVYVPKAAGGGTFTGGGGGGGGGGTKYQNYLSVVDAPTSGGGGSSGGMASSTEERLLVWTMSTDQNGRLMFGDPKVVPPKPKTLYVIYTPLRVADELPSTFQYENAGMLFVQTRDENMQPIPGTNELINVNGFFDEPAEDLPKDNPDTPDVDESEFLGSEFRSDAMVKCLMSGCTGAPTWVTKLMAERGASLAVVEYVTKLQPAYEEKPVGSGNFVPVAGVLNIEKRSVTYDGCSDPVYYNKGSYGFTLNSSLTRYLASPDGQYAPIAQLTKQVFDRDGNSPKKPYEGTVTVKTEDINKLAAYVINPADPTSTKLVAANTLPLCASDCLAALETVGDPTPMTIYRVTNTIYAGKGARTIHLFAQCSVDSPTVKFSAGWQDAGANASINWQEQVNGYTRGATFTKGKAESKQVWSTENPGMHAPCYGTASYDGKRSISLSMSGSCTYGGNLLYGSYAGYGGDTIYHNPSYVTVPSNDYNDDGLANLFDRYCPADKPYGSVSGAVWYATYNWGGGDSGGGYYANIGGQTRTGCLYDSRSGINVNHNELYYYGPAPAGSTGWGDSGSSWNWTGVCPDAWDIPVFTASGGWSRWDDTSNKYYTARTCVKKPPSTWTLRW